MATVQPGRNNKYRLIKNVGKDDHELVRVGGDHLDLVRETNLTRKLLKIGKFSGRLEHGEEATDANGEGGRGEVSETIIKIC